MNPLSGLTDRLTVGTRSPLLNAKGVLRETERWKNQVAEEEAAEAEDSRNHRRSQNQREEEKLATKPGRIVSAVPLKCPTFLAGPRLKETCRREKAARAGARGFERVTGPYFNPIRIIVKLRNIL